MATLTIRNLPDEVHDALRRQAAENRRSMEAEARDVLAAAVKPRATEEERRRAIDDLQAMGRAIAKTLPPGWLVSEELIAERRLQAAFEMGRISAEEQRDYLNRLARHDVWPKDVEQFAMRRIAGDH